MPVGPGFRRHPIYPRQFPVSSPARGMEPALTVESRSRVSRDHSRPELLPTAVQDQWWRGRPLTCAGRLGFSLPLTLPGWLAKCTGFPGVLELKVTVMPSPRLWGDHSAVLAAHSPGPPDRGPSVRCAPSSITPDLQADTPLSATHRSVHTTQLCGPRFPWSSSEPQRRVLYVPGSQRHKRSLHSARVCLSFQAQVEFENEG